MIAKLRRIRQKSADNTLFNNCFFETKELLATSEAIGKIQNCFSALLGLSPSPHAQKTSGSLLVNRLPFYFSFNYSARSVKRWKPVAVSSLSKPFKKSATEIFSFWQ